MRPPNPDLAAAGVGTPRRVPGALNVSEPIDELVLANHILARQGVVDAYGHVSSRSAGDPDHFLLTWAVAPALATAADVLTFDLSGSTPDAAGRELYSERFIHAAIYAARPDVMVVVHSHSQAIIPFTITEVDLRPVWHMSAFLGSGVALFDTQDVAGDTDLLIKNMGLAGRLANKLGGFPVALMRGHGNVVVGRSVREAVYRAVYTETNARLQAEALRMGTPVKYLTPGEAELMNAYMTPDVRRPWELWARED
jgi:ribulose-5-phosphate 4-epimerase/fuculose-1-phosphate aldolase